MNWTVQLGAEIACYQSLKIQASKSNRHSNRGGRLGNRTCFWQASLKFIHCTRLSSFFLHRKILLKENLLSHSNPSFQVVYKKKTGVRGSVAMEKLGTQKVKRRLWMDY